jgi:hypothetical protein
MNYGLINFLENKPRTTGKTFESFFHKLKYLNQKDFNVNILIVGRNRIGKTYSAISLAYALNRFFDNGIVESWNSNTPKKFWIFGLMDLLEMLNTTLKDIDKPIWLVYEEAGESLGSMEWWSLPNRIFAKITQTWGSKKINLIITLPKSRELSSGAIAQVHYGIEIKSRGFGMLCKANHRYLTSSKLGKDLYFEPLSYLTFEKPRRKVINFYEKDKSNFQQVSYEQYEKQLKAFTTKEKKSIERQLTPEKEYSFSGVDFGFN